MTETQNKKTEDIIIHNIDRAILEDIQTIHNLCEEVDVSKMVNKMLEEFVSKFRNKHLGNRVVLRKCQFRVGDYREGMMNPKNALSPELDDNALLDAYIIEEFVGYSVLYIPTIQKKSDRFWYTNNKNIIHI